MPCCRRWPSALSVNVSSRLLWLLALLVAWPSLAQSAPAERIVSLSPNLTEMAFAAGMGEQMVGVSSYSDYPEAARKIERVASWQGINVERILALKPDLILAWRGGNPQRPLDQLASLGIKILYLDPESIDQVAAALTSLAEYSPQPDLARQAAHDLLQQQTRLQQQYARKDRIPVLLQFGTQPLFTASSATLQSQVLSLCGAQNIFADSRVPWPQISREQVLLRHPAAIVITGSETQRANVRAFWHPQLSVPVIALNDDWFSRAGPRIILAAQQLCPQLAALSTPPTGNH